MSLEGKTAIVTGSTSGIGLGIIRGLAESGADVILNSFTDTAQDYALAEGIAKEFNVSARYVSADMGDGQACRGLIADVGRCDILVNNAGIQHVALTEDFPVEKWNAIIAINMNSNFHTTRLALPGMKRKNWGRIINLASVHGLVASAQKSAYVAAKHGIVGLTKVTALETAQTGVTCNAICPGWFPSEMTQGMDDESSMNFMRANSPLPRMGELHELDGALLLLASDAASFMIGQHVVVDGGWTAR